MHKVTNLCVLQVQEICLLQEAILDQGNSLELKVGTDSKICKNKCDKCLI